MSSIIKKKKSLNSGNILPMEGTKLAWLGSRDSGSLGWLLVDPSDLDIGLWVTV